jgi:hypothetical protein
MSDILQTETRPIELTILLPAYNEEQGIGETVR